MAGNPPCASNSSEVSEPACGASMRRIIDIGKMKVEFRSWTKAGRLPSTVRMLVQRTLRSLPFGRSSRSATTGSSLMRWRMTFGITGAVWLAR
jgi:hypothetical protein